MSCIIQSMHCKAYMQSYFLKRISIVLGTVYMEVGPQIGEVTYGGSPHLSCKRDQMKMSSLRGRRKKGRGTGRGRGGGKKKSAKAGKRKVPYPLSPTPLLFSLPPYPLPLSTPATQAKNER